MELDGGMHKPFELKSQSSKCKYKGDLQGCNGKWRRSQSNKETEADVTMSCGNNYFVLYFNVFLLAIFTQELFFGFSQLFISCMIYNKSTFYYNIKKIKMNLFFEKTGGV